MNLKYRILISIFLIAALFFIVSCSIIPAGIANLFATKTSTSTPTSTPTPTPAIDFISCRGFGECPPSLLIGDLAPEGNNGNGPQEVRIPYDQGVQFSSAWVVKDDILLEETLQSIEWVFKIDGQDYFTPDMPKLGRYLIGDNDETAYPGQWMGVVLQGWEIGAAHELEIGFIVTEEFFNGWRTISAGTSYVAHYQLIPAMIPTATPTLPPTFTPTATATFTPTPTNTLVPVQYIPPTSDGETLNLLIKVVNKCSEARKVVFTGPTSLTFNLSPGQSQEQRAMQGTYKWTYNVTNNVSLTFGPLAIYTTAWTLTLCD